MIFTLNKPPGWTPLEAMQAHRARTPTLASEPMVYAGRLDPMAEGLLLVLTGDDRYAVDAHLKHDKDYDATFLFGVMSDTFDALGRIAVGTAPDPAACFAAVGGLAGVHLLPLPPWCAYRVRGRPLHAWAREGRLGEIELPIRAMCVSVVQSGDPKGVRAAELAGEVTDRIGRVRGVFRQEEACADWARIAEDDPPLVMLRARLTVTSGTFIRALAQAMGAQLQCGGLLLALRRTRVGPWGTPDDI